MNFRELLGKKRLFFDGGTGSFLQGRGLRAGEPPERWNLTHPDEIVALHSAYLEAGARILTTNTFGVNALRFPDEVEALVSAAVRHAKTARAQAGLDGEAWIALDLGPTGRLLAPMGDLPFEEAVSLYAEVVRAGKKAGVDLILIETMSDTYEAKAAVLAAKENSDLPIIVTMTYDDKGRLLTGGTVDAAVSLLEGLRVDAIGTNCGLGPAQMLPIVTRLCEISSLPVVVSPNAGLPHEENKKTVYDIDADDFARVMQEIASLGAAVLGGCCGTTPTHIRALVNACKDIPVSAPAAKKRTVVSSFASAIEITDAPVIIGERINPTGKSRLKQALREENMEYLLAEGLRQEERGAHILDVNVGLPGIDEAAMMERAVVRLQSVLSLPLQLDTASPAALEAGLRAYNGKPMVNSVNGKQENMDAVFPLVQKYGGVLVALPLDEGGIPATAEGRIEIAKKIVAEAAKYGILREDIVLDGLAMTVSADPTAANAALETIARAKKELGLHTILGVSNISFGLPQRDKINAAFYTMALHNGLSFAIINLDSDEMMQAYRAYLALSGRDPQCAGYLAAYGGQTAAPAASPSGDAMPLSHCIAHGLPERAAEAAKALLAADKAPLAIINEELIPALDDVGKGFEAKTVFLPQLLMSAEAAKAAFEVLRGAMTGDGSSDEGTIILATVKGDIHDIGKNIVRVLLENYGYHVIDLGKDVAPETIVAAALEHKVQLVGLSALMTTTVVSMEETIRQLRERVPETKVVVGGAVLTAEYAASIGADFYAHDAMTTVRCAKEVFGEK
jgi:5-methyltetrahydrofolate--homocysteine methyltransferase